MIGALLFFRDSQREIEIYCEDMTDYISLYTILIKFNQIKNIDYEKYQNSEDLEQEILHNN